MSARVADEEGSFRLLFTRIMLLEAVIAPCGVILAREVTQGGAEIVESTYQLRVV